MICGWFNITILVGDKVLDGVQIASGYSEFRRPCERVSLGSTVKKAVDKEVS